MLYSDTPGSPSPVTQYKHVPFTAFLKISPIAGKRFERWHDMERIATKVETELANLCGNSEEVSFDFAKPVAFTPQFGNFPARLTVHGHICRSTSFVNEPVQEATVDNSGKIQRGYTAAKNGERNADPVLASLATSFKNQLESATGLKVYRLEVAGFIFGYKGRSFAIA